MNAPKVEPSGSWYDLADLEHVTTPPCPTPQQQCDLEYTAFLEARRIRLENAIREALYWMDRGAGNSRGRAWACLQQAITGH